MRLRRTNNSKGGAVGLDIDGGFVAAVEAEPGRLVRAVSADLPPGAMVEGEIADAEVLEGVLGELFDQQGLPRSVRLGVANQQIVVRELELPHIADPEELEAAVRFQAAEAIAMPLEEAVLDYRVSRVVPGLEGGERMQVIVVAARRAMVAQLSDTVRRAGLKPVGIDLDAFALVRALSEPSVDDSEARVLCHLGGVANLAIAVGSSCLFTRTMPGEWSEPGEQTASALAAEVRLSLDYYAAQTGAPPVSEVLLSGPGAGAEGLAEALGEALALPVVRAAPLGRLDASALAGGEDPARHTVALGLALGDAA